MKESRTASAKDPIYAALQMAFKEATYDELDETLNEVSQSQLNYVSDLRAYATKIGVDKSTGGLFINGRYLELDQVCNQNCIYTASVNNLRMH
jgi:hypothetical protein